MAGLVMFMIQMTYSFQVFLPILSNEFGWSRGLIGGAASVAIALTGIIAPLAGLFTAKYGSRRAIMVGNLTIALGFLILSLHTRVWHLYLGYGVLVGLGMGLGGLLPSTTLANNWFVRKRSLAVSIVTASSSIGGFVFMQITTMLVGSVGWRLAFLGLSIIAIIFAVVIPGIFVRNKPEDLGQVPDGVAALEQEQEGDGDNKSTLYTTPVDFTLREALRTRALWMLVFIVITVGFVQSMLYVHQMASLETKGITGIMAATAAGLLPGMGILGALGIGFLGLRINIWPLSIASLVIATLGMSLILVANSIAMVFLYNMIIGTGLGALYTCFFCIFSSYYGRANYPKILGATVPFATIFGASGAMVAGAMYDATGSYTLPFTIGIFSLLLSIVFMIFATPPKHPSLASQSARLVIDGSVAS